MPETNDFVWLVGPIALPLALALVAFVVGGKWSSVAGTAAVVGVVSLVGIVAATVWRHGPRQYWLGDWHAPLGIGLYADGLTCAMLLMSAAVGAAVSVYSVVSLSGSRLVRFWPLWLVLWTALNALFLSADIFNLYVTLELLTLASVGLIILVGDQPAIEAALRYLLAALAGSLLYLAGVTLLYGAYGTLDIASLAARAVDSGPLRAALSLILLGLIVKSALFPFHFWLPPAHSSAPAPVSALLSGLVVKATFYVLLRLWFELFPAGVTQPVAMVPTWLGAAAIVWGSWQALVAKRLKLLVAYSTVAQLGYLFLVFGLAPVGSDSGLAVYSAAVLFAISHALAKSSLFLAAGTIMHAAGHDRIDGLSGWSSRLPVTFFAMGAASVTLMGLPPSGAFVAKWTMLQVAFGAGQAALVVVMILGGFLAAGYQFRVLSTAFPGGRKEQAAGRRKRAPRVLEYTALLLALASLLLGFAAFPLTELIHVGAPWPRPDVLEAAP